MFPQSSLTLLQRGERAECAWSTAYMHTNSSTGLPLVPESRVLIVLSTQGEELKHSRERSMVWSILT